ncbi:MAG: formate dehydrogenase accessory sulfurtransferase FdhD [Paraglaciecola sp.]|nr:formate dehydrogenase accessory sulfurtransferase FdhD [Paraglaciecola sp.]
MECHDLVVTEEPLEIWLSAHPTAASKLLFTTMRTPGDDINLVRGWLYSSGAVQDSKNIISITHSGTGRLKSMPTNRVQVNLAAGAHIEIADYQRVEVMNSACGVCGQQSIESLLDKLPQAVMTHSQTSLLGMADIGSLTQQLRNKQPIFNQTGGIHGVALFDRRLQILDVHEDVGRHNAFDKLIGANLPMLAVENHESYLGVVLTSRASFELIQKAAMVNIRYVIAMGAPSSLAIDLAKDCDICLIGFVKHAGVSTEFNVYSNPQMLV